MYNGIFRNFATLQIPCLPPTRSTGKNSDHRYWTPLGVPFQIAGTGNVHGFHGGRYKRRGSVSNGQDENLPPSRGAQRLNETLHGGTAPHYLFGLWDWHVRTGRDHHHRRSHGLDHNVRLNCPQIGSSLGPREATLTIYFAAGETRRVPRHVSRFAASSASLLGCLDPYFVD